MLKDIPEAIPDRPETTAGSGGPTPAEIQANTARLLASYADYADDYLSAGRGPQVLVEADLGRVTLDPVLLRASLNSANPDKNVAYNYQTWRR